jgi:hypothetical protein
MPIRPHAAGLLVALLALAGAPPVAANPPAPPATDAPPPAPPAPPPAAPAPPAPPAPSALTLVRSAVVVEPAGRLPLSADGETVVDPGCSFELELRARVADARLVLVDPGDAHVAAAASREVGATTKLSLAPAAKLVPGSRYVLRLDGAARRELHDGDGKAYAPLAFTVLVAGTPPPPEPKPQPKKRRRR